jgi:nitroreductase
MNTKAQTDHPVHDLIGERWSPYSFVGRPVPNDALQSLFEAARWAASSYNEQPWSYIVATKEDSDGFAKLVSCLVEGNQQWAKAAPVLAIGCTALKFSRNQNPNAAALHDLGQASGYLALEATARGLAVHQMIGIVPERVRELFQVPEGVQPLTGLAIGYAGEPGLLPESMRDRDAGRRPRKPLAEFVFSGKWGTTSPIVN